MKTTSLDILEKAELPPAQSHAILKVMELEMADAYARLATKDDLKTEILGVKADILGLKVEMKASEGSLSRWVLMCILGQSAAMIGAGYFLLAHLRR